MQLAIIIGIIITFFLSFILITKKNKNLADKILATWLVFLGIHLWLFYEHIVIQSYQFPFLLGVQLPMPFLHWSFLYIYIAVLTNQYNAQKKWLLSLHFIPVVCLYVYLIEFFSLPSEEKIYVFQHQGKVPKFETFSSVMVILVSISGVIYVYFTYRLLRQHRRNIINQFSYQEIPFHGYGYDLDNYMVSWKRQYDISFRGCFRYFFRIFWHKTGGNFYE